MHIRKAMRLDGQKIINILHLAHRANYRRKLYFSNARMTKSKWIHKYNMETIFVAIQDRTIVGTISLKKHRSSMELNSLAVLPAYQHNGIGRKLIQFAESYAKKRRFSTCQLYTLEAHPWLPRYYKKQGYSRVKVIKGKRYITGKYIKRLV